MREGGRNMQKHEKYITYRANRKVYQIKIVVGKGDFRKQIVKQAKTIDDAIKIRNQLIRLYRLDPAILMDTPKDMQPSNKIKPTNFRDAFSQWYEETVNTEKIKVNTAGNYYATAKMFFRLVGRMPPENITKGIWQDIISALQIKKHYSYRYMAAHLNRIKRMYDWGIACKWYTINPCVGIHIEKTDIQPRRALTMDEMRRFFVAAKEYGNMWCLLFLLYKETGARRGEIAALQWQNVDYHNKCIYIRYSLKYDYVHHTQVLGSPKTKASIRSIPISDKILLCLKQRQRQIGYVDPDAYVFTGRNKHEAIRLTSISAIFAKIRTAAGLDKHLTLHCFRHTLASKLITSGIDIPTVQRIGGWATPDMLLSVYAHSNDDAARQALQKVIF